jgi:2-dehydropantoate 2-reductase
VSALEGTRLERLDPGGTIARAIAPQRIVGSLVYFATEITEPGVVRHVEGDRMPVGEPNEVRSDRCRQVAKALTASGIRAPVVSSIRREIWVKLLGNVALNPISALTGATLAQILAEPDTRRLTREVMAEAEAVAHALGVRLPISIDQRMEGAAKVGDHKTSMLQDLEAGRPLELEALAGAVIDIGERLGVELPRTRALYACTKLAAKRPRR